jgi:hypothetical protein
MSGLQVRQFSRVSHRVARKAALDAQRRRS